MRFFPSLGACEAGLCGVGVKIHKILTQEESKFATSDAVKLTKVFKLTRDEAEMLRNETPRIRYFNVTPKLWEQSMTSAKSYFPDEFKDWKNSLSNITPEDTCVSSDNFSDDVSDNASEASVDAVGRSNVLKEKAELCIRLADLAEKTKEWVDKEYKVLHIGYPKDGKLVFEWLLVDKVPQVDKAHQNTEE